VRFCYDEDVSSDEPCNYRISVKGIAIDEAGRFLLSKESSGKWELLGGGLEHDEEPIDGLKREIREETGLEVTYVSPAPKYFVTFPKPEYRGYAANVVYEIKLKSLDFVPSDECTELRYFTVEEARKEELFPTVEKFLRLYNPKLN
jgi:8-oxo-dGTP diphosphatase